MRSQAGETHCCFSSIIRLSFPPKMYYKISGVTGKLTGATPPAAYSPQGLKPTVPSEASPLIFASPTKLSSHAKPAVAYMGNNNVPELQRLFQRSDGLPIHLKGGYIDRMMYRATMGLTIGGTLYCLMALYFAAQPKK